MTMKLDFGIFANRCSAVIGRPWFFMVNSVLCLLCLVLPAYYDFSITVISVVTYLIAILIQRTQNEQEDRAQIKLDGVNEKLDELIRTSCNADNALMGIERGKLR